MDITKKQKLVLDAIKSNPQAANDDALLLSIIWAGEIQRKGSRVTQDELYRLLRAVTRPETITRRRRELFNKGLITYSKEADNTREKAFERERRINARD